MKRTREELYEVMNSMRARGAKIINRTVRDEIGGGSMSDIQPVVKSFLAEFPEGARGVATVVPPAQGAGPVTVPPAVQRILDNVTAALAPLAAEVEHARADAIETERAHARSEINAIQEGAAASQRALQVEIDDAGSTVTELVAECEELKAAISGHMATIAALSDARDGLDRQVIHFTADLDHARRGKADADAEIASIGEQLTASQSETQAARSEAARASAAAEAAGAEAQRLRSQIEALMAEAKVAAGQIAKLDTAAAVAVERAENLTSQAAKADQERQASEALAREALSRAARAEAEAGAASKDATRLQEDIVQLRADHASALAAAEAKADARATELRTEHAAVLAAVEARLVRTPEATVPAIQEPTPAKAKGKAVAAH